MAARKKAAKVRINFADMGRPDKESIDNVLVTPEDAMTILDLSEERGYINRAVSDAGVQRLALAIKSGRWKENGATIVVRKDGVLLDGYHRMWAIVESGVAMPLDFKLGIDPSARETIDTGGKGSRDLRDVMRMMGVQHYSAVAGALRVYAHYKKGCLRSGIALHNQEYLEVFKKNKGIESSVALCQRLRKVVGYVNYASFCHYVFRKINEPVANDFILRLASGAGLSEGSPILALRERMMRQKMLESQKKASVLRPIELAYLYFAAWNGLVTGATIRQLRLPAREQVINVPEPLDPAHYNVK